METIIRTDVLLDNSGREYDLGRAYYRTVNLKVLSKDEADKCMRQLLDNGWMAVTIRAPHDRPYLCMN